MATTITTAAGLQNMDLDLTGDYILGNDINCSGIANFEPVGGWNGQDPFTGSFDGKGCKIYNLTVDRAADDYIGLFGYVNGATYVKNVTIEDFTLTGDDYIGALAGYMQATPVSDITVINVTITGDDYSGGLCGTVYTSGTDTITDCSVTGSVTCATGNQDGGFIGQFYGYTCNDCYTEATVSGGNFAGGFAGYMNGGSILRCYATGTVACANDRLGGFIGQLTSSGTIDRCYASGAVTCIDDKTGGFIGDHVAGTISDCYATGAVTGDDMIGGFAGQCNDVNRCYSTGLITHGVAATDVGGFTGNNNETLVDCFWDTTTSGESTGAGGGTSQTGVTGKATADMKLTTTFQSANWLISRVWNLLAGCNSNYPCLIDVNPCCSVASNPSDRTIAKQRVSLEAIRNLEITYSGRFFIDKSGNATWESRFHRGV